MSIDAVGPTLVFMMDEVGGKLEFHGMDRGDPEAAEPGRGPVTFLPKGFFASGSAATIRLFRRVVIELDAGELSRISDAGGPSSRRELALPHHMVSDERIENLCRLIAEESCDPGTNSGQYGEGLILALMVGLTRWRRKPLKQLSRGGLAPWQLRRSQGFMIEHIADSISLQALAELTGVSLAHFSRAFKSSTGQSPYQWLIAARIDKAKQLLLDKTLPIAEISIALGFCDQAHLTRTFLKAVGTTPLAWQRSHLT
ncbi:AraC family transcriptional regulator [Rhizobium calliandrae]|nr:MULTISPECIES: AraC family transcriptional regulator [Rhizobium]MDL2406932.1 AraC family transcriptional regulator [Rhizobium calliandrae]